MKTSEFTFDLPEHLIAQHPPAERGQSRLMLMDRKKGSYEHRMMRELPSLLESGTLMVFNNSKVRRARLLGVSEASGAKVEFLLLNKEKDKNESHESGCLWRVMVQRASRRHKGSRYIFAPGNTAPGSITGGVSAEIIDEEGEFRLLRFNRPIDDTWLDIHGQVPLPPYIKRDDTTEDEAENDSERYQTVYAKEYGSAAAPTAGLHFTEELLAGLENAGIECAFITLHVGAGTFLPVRAENIEDHKMHEEVYNINDETACRIEKARAEGRKILAVGTTSVRTLETVMQEDGTVRRGEGSSSIFIYPGYKFKAVDALFTNFHTPESTLLMLVSAFAGRDFILKCYREAVKQEYRFFSYGDASLII